MKKRVVVAMSGGVDSATAAYLLLKQGYEVIGVSLKLFSSQNESPLGHYSGCCGIQGIDDARAVAYKLRIPFYALNYEKEFKEKVIYRFSFEYISGRTPNPCIMCNEEIKFKSLLKKAESLGADYIATGHYAKVKYDKKNKRYIIKKAKDREKDQSYFLFSLPQESLRHSLFPLADFTKNEVRNLAKKIGIKVHSKPASQEICFIPDDDYRRFLINENPGIAIPGPVINKEGKILGEHKGVAFYTVGQRRGLGIPYKWPLYVLDIDKRKNIIVVGAEDEVYSKKLTAANTNWVSIGGIKNSLRVKAKIRYNQKDADAIVSKLSNDKVKVEFIKPQRSITPGQAVVFYKHDTLIGGGIITKSL